MRPHPAAEAAHGLFKPKNVFVDESQVSSGWAPLRTARAQEITDCTVTLVKDDADALPLAKGTQKVLVTGASVTAGLAERIAARGPAATAYNTGTAPTDATIAAAVAQAQASDQVVVRPTRPATSRRSAEAGQAAAGHRQAGRRGRRARPVRHRVLHRRADLSRDVLHHRDLDGVAGQGALRRGPADGPLPVSIPDGRRPGRDALPLRPRPGRPRHDGPTGPRPGSGAGFLGARGAAAAGVAAGPRWPPRPRLRPAPSRRPAGADRLRGAARRAATACWAASRSASSPTPPASRPT